MIKVVVICEDHTLDQYILKPVIEQIMTECGRRVRIQFASDPPLRGIEQALQKATLTAVLRRYPMAQLFLLLVDRDCKEASRTTRLRSRIEQADKAGRKLFGCLAIEEVEVWALALHRSELPDRREAVRAHCHPKEAYFRPLVGQRGWDLSLGKGRRSAIADLRQKWDSLKALCPEVADLTAEIRAWLSATALA
jgi:hypothetical protein